MSTATDELPGVELSEVEAAVGSRAFGRGRGYARGNRVLSVEWDPDAETLTGSVVGQGAVYSTAAFFDDHDGAPTFEAGECTCPVGYNCKHVAAIAIAATDGRGDRPRAGPPPRESSAAASTPSWEQPLRALIEAPALQATGSPLAIELAPHANGLGGGGPLRLMARLMRPGKRGGWVNGSLAWSDLDSWQIRGGEHRADHLALARELCAVQRARDTRPPYYYGYGAEKTLDLSDCSAQLWPLLDEAARVGLALVHARKELGELPPHARGEILIDVTRQGGERHRGGRRRGRPQDAEGSLVRPRLRIEGDDAGGLEPLLFLGTSGHGVVCTEAGAGGDPEESRLRLVRLARPAPPELQRMVLDGQTLALPASELERFAEEICPGLRGVATVVSSDGSFTPPEVSDPELVLRASYGEGHAVEVGWEWIYRVGTSERRAPLGVNGAGPGFRDLDAERAILSRTLLAGAPLERYGLLDGAGRPADVAPASLSGLESMRLTTEELPLLAERHGLAVEVAGEPAPYRDVSDAVEIGVSTADIAGERDWFDLGVTITVDGRELPFAEVFTALASGESQMLLEDGAHFSLLEPRLQSLRQLIEEATELAESPAAPLRISRYQAGLWSELAALGVVTEQARAWERQVGALIDLDALGEHEPPAALAARPRPYQRDGFGWLASIWELELGGILADDMGLGKTLQALALICHAREREADLGPFLVVAPTSVVSG